MAGTLKRLEVHEDADRLASNKKIVNDSLRDRMKIVQSHLDSFSKYNHLIPGGESDQFLDKFCTEEHSFKEVLDKVLEYKEIANEIADLPTIIVCEAISVDSHPLLDALKTRADECTRTLIDKLSQIHRDFNTKVCESYESIKRRALKDPEDTKELMKLMEIMETVKLTQLGELKKSIEVSQSQLISLMDLHPFSEDELALNTTTLAW